MKLIGILVLLVLLVPVALACDIDECDSLESSSVSCNSPHASGYFDYALTLSRVEGNEVTVVVPFEPLGTLSEGQSVTYDSRTILVSDIDTADLHSRTAVVSVDGNECTLTSTQKLVCGGLTLDFYLDPDPQKISLRVYPENPDSFTIGLGQAKEFRGTKFILAWIDKKFPTPGCEADITFLHDENECMRYCYPTCGDGTCGYHEEEWTRQYYCPEDCEDDGADEVNLEIKNFKSEDGRITFDFTIESSQSLSEMQLRLDARQLSSNENIFGGFICDPLTSPSYNPSCSLVNIAPGEHSGQLSIDLHPYMNFVSFQTGKPVPMRDFFQGQLELTLVLKERGLIDVASDSHVFVAIEADDDWFAKGKSINNFLLGAKSNPSSTVITGETSADDAAARRLAEILPQSTNNIRHASSAGNHEIAVLIGGPCANSIVADLLRDMPGYRCSDWSLPPGKALLKRIDVNEKHYILVAGTTADDTEYAAGKLRDSANNPIADEEKILTI